MRAIILAAGFATRLYPLTRHTPKPLLEVGGMTIIDRLLGLLRDHGVADIDVVTNAYFADQFRRWCPADVSLHVSPARSNEERLGAVADLQWVLERTEHSRPCLVVAADTLFNFTLGPVLKRFQEAERSLVCVWPNPIPADRSQRGNVVIGANSQIVTFEEKPRHPKSIWSSAPLYCYTPEALGAVAEYLSQGGHADAPGHLLQWLVQQLPVIAYRLVEAPVDIGTPAALKSARLRFAR